MNPSEFLVHLSKRDLHFFREKLCQLPAEVAEDVAIAERSEMHSSLPLTARWN